MTADPTLEQVPRALPRWRVAVDRLTLAVSAGVIVASAVAAVHLTDLETSTEQVQAPARLAVPATTPAQSTSNTRIAPSQAGAPALSSTTRVDPTWAQHVAAATGIPDRALLAYASADLTIGEERPGCGLGWNTLAAIGAIETGHGSHAGATLGEDGRPTPVILGPVLDGQQFAAVPDSDDGAWDGDATWDRAVGPMQFIPSAWTRWSADGNGDGVGDPNQIDDATLGAARYLCASGAMTTADEWRAAVFSYNHSDDYIDEVARVANRFAAAAEGVS